MEITLELLKQIILNVPNYVFWKDNNLVYRGANHNFAKNLDFFSVDQLIGKTDFDIPSTQALAHEYQKEDQHILRGGPPILGKEVQLKTINAGNKTLSVSKVPLYGNNHEIIGVLGVYIDITHIKENEALLSQAKETAENALMSLQKSQLEEQKQRKEAERLEIENTKHMAELKIAKITAEKEQEMRKTVMVLVGDIVHDLYTPLAIIDGGANILESISSGLREVIKEADELKSEKLSLINKKKLSYVINDMSIAQKDSIRMINAFIDATIRELLVTQKYQDGTIAHEELTKCSSRRVLENVMDSYPHREGITINQSFPYDFFFMGNSILMMKVLFNLIRNAEEQIITNGKGEITITTEKTEDKNLLIVKDTAGGAPPEVVENFFKEFFTTKKDGSGIGLAFCKKMMRNFGGDLTCRSFFGESMEFILSFPKIDDTKS